MFWKKKDEETFHLIHMINDSFNAKHEDLMQEMALLRQMVAHSLSEIKESVKRMRPIFLRKKGRKNEAKQGETNMHDMSERI